MGRRGVVPHGVYPRVCGGTLPAGLGIAALPGLSPRVRGNPAERPDAGAGPRSIPACAGEPLQPRRHNPSSLVYPRVCGGTPGAGVAIWGWRGLSPRVRGNPSETVSDSVVPRSIPACAGEPCSTAACWHLRRVYPRVCGGTWVVLMDITGAQGLSPRVRGNLQSRPYEPGFKRSIPACAGEPTRCEMCLTARQVYPRVCGGTYHNGTEVSHGSGLSPRVRGNHLAVLLHNETVRSIPACAGEPLPR